MVNGMWCRIDAMFDELVNGLSFRDRLLCMSQFLAVVKVLAPIFIFNAVSDN